MITIKQTQKKIPFDAKQYQKKAFTILTYLNYQDFDLGILLTTNATIRKYNKIFRQKDSATDVLSFPYHSQTKAGKRIKKKSNDDSNLGDIIISIPYVFANQKKLEGSFEYRMDQMLVHAICHLLGYDHIDENDFKKMQKLERKLLALIR
ncbi:rRNA maturation RNase YbeY [Candidatus Dependentiae bacterium]|nr:rRNA maturation RNase YbeY [Candidatus Dependentiae bacterium]